jgi:ComF family protein
MILQSLWNKCANIVPRHCLFCLEKTCNSIELCQHCIDLLSLNNHCCQRCASPMEQVVNQQIVLCGNCLSHHYYYDKVYSPYVYSEDIRYLITKLKYQKKIHYANILSALFLQQIPNIKDFQLPEIFIAMPMHNTRLRQRGFNQALEISRHLSGHYQLPLDHSSLYRRRYTNLQAGLIATDRQKNVINAFAMKKTLAYEHIALIDDVMTTGSTVNEAAKVLKKSGIKQVDVWSIARAGLK